jgi:UDP-N-acetylglucosamine 4,6-dehydratase
MKNFAKMLKGRSLLITGGTGSFGRYLISYLLKHYNLNKIIIFSRDEKKQFDMAQSKEFNPNKFKALRYFIGDVRDYNRLNYAMEGCDYVIHAAALKHVEIAEYNPMEVIKTNINGADNIIRACLENNVKKIIALSTDKAVNPINLYGATKLASDKLFIAANNIVGKKECAFSIVRYGNVVGSRGSVIEIFKNLKRNNTKFYPITHNLMTRFWITLEDSVKFVLSSLHRMNGGEIFVPKISSINIRDLVPVFDKNAKVKIIGLRPGEKLHEVLISKEDSDHAIEFSDFFIIKPQIKFTSVDTNYYITKLGEKGKNFRCNTEYNSLNNPSFLSIKDLKELIAKI